VKKLLNNRIILAFAAIYVIWGSTFLGIRIAIETIPPFLMAGIRHLTAGLILYPWSRARGAARPTAIEWRSTAIIGVALLCVSNGTVTWSEQRLPSGIAALIVATIPMWIALLAWAGRKGVRPNRGTIAGLVMGFAGIVLLIGPDRILGHGKIDLAAATALIFAGAFWAKGSLFSRTAKLPSSQLQAAGMEMLAGGAALLVLSGVTGELSHFDPSAVSLRSWLALGYLTVGGSIVGFTAYAWLFRATTPSRVATYAYVNPVIAILLGWGFAGEELDAHVFVAAGVIVLAVVLIITAQQKGSYRLLFRKAADKPAPIAAAKESLTIGD
jgi:drug/metabolite transporter (DMT)-like permease